MANLRFPSATRTDARKTCLGRSWLDPYDWLSDPQSPQRHQWLEEQETLIRKTLRNSRAGKRASKYLMDHWRTPIPHASVRVGGRVFSFRQSESDGNPSLVVSSNSGSTTRLIFGNGRKWEEAESSLYTYLLSPSPSGRYVAFGVKSPEIDPVEIWIYDCDADRLLKDRVKSTLVPTLAWAPDESGFWYNATRGVYRMKGREPEENAVLFHPLGDDFSSDQLVWEEPWGDGRMAIPIVPPGSGYLCLALLRPLTFQHGFAVRQLDSNEPFKTLIPSGLGWSAFIGVSGRSFYFAVDRPEVPKGHIIKIELPDAGEPVESVVVPAEERSLARSMFYESRLHSLCGDALFLTYVDETEHKLEKIELNGRKKVSVEFGVPVTVNDMRLSESGSLYVNAQSYAQPPRDIAVDVATGKTVGFGEGKHGAVSVMKRVVVARDGTKVPISLVSIPSKKSKRAKFLILSGYGSLGAQLTPKFANDIGLWLAAGGSFAIAHVRGGGEKGREWHEAGRREKKPTTFDDFCDVAEFLVQEGYVRPGGVIAKGASNGGLLSIGSALRQPDLFGGAIGEIPNIDVLSMVMSAGGGTAMAEHGDPQNDESILDVILSYSPLQNLPDSKRWPPMLLLPGEIDDRCRPEWSYKFVAEAQSRPEAGGPVLLSVLKACGHVGWPAQSRRRAICDEFAFVMNFVKCQQQRWLAWGRR